MFSRRARLRGAWDTVPGSGYCEPVRCKLHGCHGVPSATVFHTRGYSRGTILIRWSETGLVWSNNGILLLAAFGLTSLISLVKEKGFCLTRGTHALAICLDFGFWILEYDADMTLE